MRKGRMAGIGLGGCGCNIITDLYPLIGDKQEVKFYYLDDNAPNHHSIKLLEIDTIPTDISNIFIITGVGNLNSMHRLLRFAEITTAIRNTLPHAKIRGIAILPFDFEGQSVFTKWQEQISALHSIIYSVMFMHNDIVCKKYPDISLQLMNIPLCKRVLRIMGHSPSDMTEQHADVQEILSCDDTSELTLYSRIENSVVIPLYEGITTKISDCILGASSLTWDYRRIYGEYPHCVQLMKPYTPGNSHIETIHNHYGFPILVGNLRGFCKDNIYWVYGSHKDIEDFTKNI